MMIKFGKTKIYLYSDDIILLKADITETIDNQQDICLSYGTPCEWDTAVLNLVKDSYSLYEIDVKKIQSNMVNRVTDFKKIWGLLSIPKGLFDAKIVKKDFTLYMGISQIDTKTFINSPSSLFLFCPYEFNDDIEKIWKYLLDSVQSSQDYDMIHCLKKVTEKYPFAIGLCYSFISSAELALVSISSRSMLTNMCLTETKDNIGIHYRNVQRYAGNNVLDINDNN